MNTHEIDDNILKDGYMIFLTTYSTHLENVIYTFDYNTKHM